MILYALQLLINRGWMHFSMIPYNNFGKKITCAAVERGEVRAREGLKIIRHLCVMMWMDTNDGFELTCHVCVCYLIIMCEACESRLFKQTRAIII